MKCNVTSRVPQVCASDTYSSKVIRANFRLQSFHVCKDVSVSGHSVGLIIKIWTASHLMLSSDMSPKFSACLSAWNNQPGKVHLAVWRGWLVSWILGFEKSMFRCLSLDCVIMCYFNERLETKYCTYIIVVKSFNFLKYWSIPRHDWTRPRCEDLTN